MKNEELISKLMVESMVLAPFSDVGRFDAIKFAELIVLECVSILDKDDGATHHSKLLLEHFGVAEDD